MRGLSGKKREEGGRKNIQGKKGGMVKRGERKKGELKQLRKGRGRLRKGRGREVKGQGQNKVLKEDEKSEGIEVIYLKVVRVKDVRNLHLGTLRRGKSGNGALPKGKSKRKLG